jgi:Tfp pilus assembly protein PilV
MRRSLQGRPGAAGFSLAEVLVALSLMWIALMAAAPLFITALKETASGADIGSVGAAAVDRMELLRGTDFYSLAAGGSVASNVSGFSDTANPVWTVRWQITDNATPATLKTISVRAIATRQVIGLQKEITLNSVRAR